MAVSPQWKVWGDRPQAQNPPRPLRGDVARDLSPGSFETVVSNPLTSPPARHSWSAETAILISGRATCYTSAPDTLVRASSGPAHSRSSAPHTPPRVPAHSRLRNPSRDISALQLLPTARSRETWARRGAGRERRHNKHGGRSCDAGERWGGGGGEQGCADSSVQLSGGE